MDYIVDEARRDLVLDAILDRYRRGAYPYNKKRSMLAVLEMPKRLERGGEDEARFWFFSCMLMRGGIDSDVAMSALSIMYDQQMRRGGLWPFIPHKAAKLTDTQMAALIKDAGTGIERYARDWINAAKILVRNYDGSVLELMSGFNGDYETVAKLLRNQNGQGFPGMQYKMVSMFLFFITEANLIEYFHYPPPVDFHLQRVATETEIIDRDDVVDRSADWVMAVGKSGDVLQEVLRQTYTKYIIKNGIKSNELSDAVWLHSRMLCRNAPGNLTQRPETEEIGRSRPVVIPGVDFTKSRDLNKYLGSCMRCPVKRHCTRNVSSGHYYVKGEIRVLGPRQEPPDHMFTQTLIDTDEGDNQIEVFSRPPKAKPEPAKSLDEAGQLAIELSPAQT